MVRAPGGEFLVVRRPDDPADELAGLWGLPAVTRRPGEDERAAAARIGPDKLGVRLRLGGRVGARSAQRGSYLLTLAEYEAAIVAGLLAVPQPDDSVTQYDACRFTGDPAVLAPAAARGSLCAQIFLAAASSAADACRTMPR